MKERGFHVERDNRTAVSAARVIVLAIQPKQLDDVLGVGPALRPANHVVISVVTGVSIEAIEAKLTAGVPVIRAMPNTGTAVANRGPASRRHQDAKRPSASPSRCSAQSAAPW